MPPVEVHHYETESGRDPIREFLEEQPVLERAACDEVISWLESGEIDQRPRHRDHLGDGLWELRLSINRKQYRFLYATRGSRAYLLVAFVKKTQQTPTRQLELARRRWRELRQRGIVT